MKSTIFMALNPGTIKVCCIFNIAPHYRSSIYQLMDNELNCEFFIGDRISYSIELMNYNSLKGFKKRLKFIPLTGNFYWQKGAVSLSFKSYKYYILTGEPHCISSWLILLLNKFTNKKTHLWTHGWYGNETLVKKILKKAFFGLSDKVLLYGDYARNLMIKEGFEPNKLLSIYNSLDYNKQVQIRQNLRETLIYEQHFNNKYPVILYIGRIQSSKKIELLIEAIYELKKRKLFCNLMLIGKQYDYTVINKLVTLYELDKYVWFLGPCYDENILGEYIYNANVCVSPGNVGLTAIHSLVYGTPVITHNNFANQMPEFEAIEEGVSGDYFVENSVDDLCTKIINWISIAGEQRACIRTNCYKVIDEKYNPKKQLDTLKRIIKLSNEDPSSN